MNIVEVTLLARHLAPLRDFYVDRLGFTLLGDTGETLTVAVGRSRLVFRRTDSHENPFYHFAMNIPENRFAEALRWVAERETLLDGPDGPEVFFENWNAHAFYFRDPAGNVVEYIARHGLDNATADPFGPDKVEGVSEVGLPVRNVDEAIRAIEVGLSTDVWDRGGPRFAAVGDEEGLFILVADTHEWYPIALPVGVFPVDVTIEASVERTLQLPGTPYLIRTTAEDEPQPRSSTGT